MISDGIINIQEIMIEFKFCICGTAGPRRNDHVQQGRRLDSDH